VLWHCWLGGRKGIRPVKKMGGWWRWALVSPDGVASSWMVSVSASVNLPLHHKVQNFSSGTDSPGWSRRKGRKTVVVVVLWHCCLGIRKSIRPVKKLSDKVLGFTDVSRTITFPDRRLPDKTFPGQVILRNFHVHDLHTLCTWKFLSITCPGDVCPGKWMSGKHL